MTKYTLSPSGATDLIDDVASEPEDHRPDPETSTDRHGDDAEAGATPLLGDDDTTDAADSEPPANDGPARHRRLALIFGIVFVTALSAMTGWLGYRTNQAVQDEHRRSQFLDAGRRGAIELTTINYTEADSDAARILSMATGRFYEDFQQRSQAFIEMVKKTQSKTDGTVTEAGLESVDGDHADVLVMVSVKTSLAGSETQPRLWRMRISVERVGDETKVSDVAFVP